MSTATISCPRRFLLAASVVAAAIGVSVAAPVSAVAGNCPSGQVEEYRGDPPTVLYRADTRGPDEIRATGGFAPRGSDRDLVNHATGGVHLASSAYVAATDNLVSAANVANQRLRELRSAAEEARRAYGVEPSRPRVWIYEISANPTFHHVATSLYSLATRAEIRQGALMGTGNTQAVREWEQYIGRIGSLYRMATAQGEWATQQPVGQDSIIRAYPVDQEIEVPAGRPVDQNPCGESDAQADREEVHRVMQVNLLLSSADAPIENASPLNITASRAPFYMWLPDHPERVPR